MLLFFVASAAAYCTGDHTCAYDTDDALSLLQLRDDTEALEIGDVNASSGAENLADAGLKIEPDKMALLRDGKGLKKSLFGPGPEGHQGAKRGGRPSDLFGPGAWGHKGGKGPGQRPGDERKPMEGKKGKRKKNKGKKKLAKMCMKAKITKCVKEANDNCAKDPSCTKVSPAELKKIMSTCMKKAKPECAPGKMNRPIKGQSR